MSGEAGSLVTSSGELEVGVREWVHETLAILRHELEATYPATGNFGRGLRRELLTIHVRKGADLIRGQTPETAAADALREAVTWYELREEAERNGGRTVEEAPRWLRWAYRLLPSVGLSRWARLSLRTVDDAERALDARGPS